MTATTDKVKIKLTGVPETAVYTLWVKANSTRLGKDEWAIQAVERIGNYDFSKFDLKTGVSFFVPMRCELFDKWTINFLTKHTKATVVNLACGLDSRALRLMRTFPEVRWVDVDLPEMVKLREQLFPNPDGDYKLVAASATEEAWLVNIPTDRPTLVAMEGLLMYLDAGETESLLKRLVDYFQVGELHFDTIGWLSLYMPRNVMDFLRETGSSFRGSVEDPLTLEKIHPRLKFRDAVRHADYDGIEEWPFRMRWIWKIIWYIPYMRNFQITSRFEFGSNVQL